MNGASGPVSAGSVTSQARRQDVPPDTPMQSEVFNPFQYKPIPSGAGDGEFGPFTDAQDRMQEFRNSRMNRGYGGGPVPFGA